MENLNQQCAIGFIEDIWNMGRFEKLGNYLHADFCDHSLPDFCQNRYGLILYLKALGRELKHHTSMEEITCEGELVVIRFSLLSSRRTSHQDEKSVVLGYRYLRMQENKIVDHWEMIQSIKPCASSDAALALAS
ncbi:ester cyclase [Dyadobacter sp. CY327]|uniref:ester cyclase n=1 Tax=Dyadobacter sp. CY327 TaxID=2907301 RepID=UPI001F4035B9|nr:ester cyclase [Dyadobacter sp. CY327]MCE7072569.1 ester cyclase [Dyadobacter sp. CY327]